LVAAIFRPARRLIRCAAQRCLAGQREGAVTKPPQGTTPTDVKRRFIGDFSAWETATTYQVAFERLLRDLKAEGADEDTEPGPDAP